MLALMVTSASSAGTQKNSSFGENLSAMRNSNKTVVSQVAFKINTTSTTQNKTVSKDPPRMGREHIIDKPHLNSTSVPKILEKFNNSKNTSEKTTSRNETLEQKPSRDAVKNLTETNKLDSSSLTPTNSTKLNSYTKDTAINSTSMVQGNSSTSSMSTNTKIDTNNNHSTVAKPRKPIVTEHDDIPKDLKSEPYPLDIPSIDTTFKKKSKQADYVIPIVAVILSIPLVTIIFSVLFKRGKDWWQHRNYKRVDYLIEGMYQS
nr:putative uncharacterized protein DDB_G0281733 [Leptinotarsa decemlineata]